MPHRRSRMFHSQVTSGLLAMAFFLIIVTSVISITATKELSESIDAINDSEQAIEVSAKIENAINEAQANRLRYLITNDQKNLARQKQSLSDLLMYQWKLSEMTSDNPLQRAYLQDFSLESKQYVELSQKDIQIKQAAVRSGDFGTPVAIIRRGKGIEKIKSLQTILGKIKAEQFRIKAEQENTRYELLKQTNATMLVTNGLALVAGFIAFLAIRKSQKETESFILADLRLEQAKRASDEKSSFLANMSHEIRTPMNAIFGFTQLLSSSVTNPIEREWISAIKKSGQLLLSLINDVLDLSKIEAGKLQLHLQPTNVRELVNETVEMFLPATRDKGIVLANEIDHDLNEPLMLDGQRLRQILLNLLSNATKYTESGGIEVRLSTSLDADENFRQLTIQVSDSGVGIDAEQLSQIFEPFHQAQGPDGKLRQGTGLGLSICKRLVDVMGGKITVNSSVGKGATFTVEIPNIAVATVMPDMYELLDTKTDFNLLPPLTILVVDDVAWNAEIAIGYIGKSHHKVHVANNGLAAISNVRALKPDVVLMDLRMEGLNGYEATEAIRIDPQLSDEKISIIAVTASYLDERDSSIREKFDGYLRKPYSPSDLFNTLSALFSPEQKMQAEIRKEPLLWDVSMQQEWETLHRQELHCLRQNMRMREIGDYARKLQVFSTQAQFALLGDQASKLLNAMQRFDVTCVNRVLSEIAALPESFDAR